ncbi:MAG: (d)CMP kinase [Christensenellaceae bacterium]|jgi:cytidylate kinase|nr:(d)CMP kinase [Christensenellaceae bacterium]
MSSNYIIAIDGPAASGKGTVAKMLGQRFGVICLDTGCIYRGITIYFLDKQIDSNNLEQIQAHINKIDLDVKCDASGETLVFVGGQDVTKRLQTVITSQYVAGYAKIPVVRTRVREIQKRTAEAQSLVCEGRDITSVVFPEARHKFYLTSSLSVRAKRRYNQEVKAGEKVTFKQVRDAIASRDKADMTRKYSPLKKVAGAVKIDSTKLTAEQTADKMERIIRKHIKSDTKKADIPNDFRPPRGASVFRKWVKIHLCLPYKLLYFSGIVKNKDFRDIKKYRGRPVIFAFNHRSNSDVVAYYLSFPRFRLNFIGKESLFKHEPLNWFLRSLDGFPIRYGKNDMAVIRYSLDILKQGKALAIFPEGRRNFDSESALEIQPGTAMIAMKSGAPVIPVVTNRPARPLRRNRIKVGPAIFPNQFSNRDDFSNKLKSEMATLLDGFEVKPKQKKWDKIPVFNSRAIVFRDGKLVAIKRHKEEGMSAFGDSPNKDFFVFPGGHIDEGETAREAVVREIAEETNIQSVAVRPLYKKMFKTKRGEGMQVFYLCNYKSGEVSKTDAEEYTKNDPNNTYEPVLLDIESLAKLDLRPHAVRDRLVRDIKRYGIHLTRPTIYLK